MPTPEQRRAADLAKAQRRYADTMFHALRADMQELEHYEANGGIRSHNLERLQEDVARMRRVLLRAEAFDQFAGEDGSTPNS